MKPIGRTETPLDGQVVAITGGARGIGLATAIACHEAGMRVAIGDLDADLVASAAASVGPGVSGIQLDVSRHESFASFLDAAEQQLGSLDVLVNNAGVFAAGRYGDEPDDVTARLIATNIGGCAIGSKLAVRRFLASGHGHIVNIASIGAVVATAGAATYSATKHAVLGLTRSLRWELAGTDIRTTVVMPGIIETEMTAPMKRPKGIAPPTVPPSAVGHAVVGALRTGKAEVFVPSALTPVARLLGMMGPSSGDAIKRLTGFDRMLIDQDPQAAAAYRRRVDSEQASAISQP
jgi:NAD(P)-dependent dehydrogenase (short-subunit alcohol dehydrogenase family)